MSAPPAVATLRLRGPNVSLRYPRPDDAPRLLELGRDPQVTRFFSWGPYRHVMEPLRWIESVGRQREEGIRLELVIAGPGDEPLGVTGLSEFSLRDRRAVVGTWLGRPSWGTGANAESKALVLALAFRGLALIRATALANPRNVRSVRALERLGFVHEGVLRGWHVHRGTPEDCAVLGLLREEWEGGSLARVPVAVEGPLPPRFVARGR